MSGRTEPYVAKEVAAEHLGVSARTMEDWVHKREVPFHKVGRLVRFRLSELDAWVAECTQQELAPTVRSRAMRAVS